MARKKKKNYRLRKSVRRTLGALFMISAIIVAAIPFPDAAATDGIDFQSVSGNNSSTTPAALTYNVTNADKESVNTSVDLDEDGDKKAYTLRRIESLNQWRYEWQFEFYLVQNSSGQGGIISEYNSDYPVEHIVLQEAINTEYVTIPANTFDTYFSSGEGNQDYTLNISNKDNFEVDYKFKTYFNTKYQEFNTNYTQKVNEYNIAHQAWVDGGRQGEEPTAPSGDDVKVTANPYDLSDALRRAYYCDFGLKDSQQKTYLFNKGYTLEAVYEPAHQTTEGDTVTDVPTTMLYIPKATANAADVDGYVKDNQGFLYPMGTAYDIIGIGEEAFKDVKKVQTIELPQSISYIGESAFENSFIQKVTIANVSEIGNKAFKNCSRLAEVVLANATEVIGMEAFYNTSLTSINFPYSVRKIGAGAFAENANLASLDFTNLTAGNAEIGKYAFFNCPSLNSVLLKDMKIAGVGEAAFALNKGETGNCVRFEFPALISDVSKIGDYILAGRTNLQEVLMPAELGRSGSATLPGHLFDGCRNLKFVEFPADSGGSCGYLTFPNTIFSQIVNPDFYVKGPSVDYNGNIAAPRKATWACSSIALEHIPYVYEINNVDYYEVSDGDYVLLIDENGQLQSCEFVDDIPTQISNLIIPGNVGNIAVTSIKEGCFDDTFLDYINKLTIEDGGSLKEIGNGVFENSAMTEAYIGNSVEKIGSRAFANTNLTNVTIGSNIKEIGAEAFKDCNILTEVLFMEPNDPSAFTINGIGNEAFTTGSPKLTFIGTITLDYGPFAWAMQADNYVDSRTSVRVCYKTPSPTYLNVIEDNKKDPANRQPIPTDLTVILDNQNNYPTLVDYTHYSDISEDIRTAYENGQPLGYAEEALVKSALKISVPEGVKSIDAKGYFNDSSMTVDGVEPYTNSNSWDAYFNDGTKSLYYEYGLFGGYYGEESGTDGQKEYPVGDNAEVNAIGNDRIQEISLPSVVYLPEKVFDSCENLNFVQVGSDIETIESLPFHDCTSLTSVGFGNDKFVCNNGILYENNADGTKTILEGLASRGKAVGSSSINLSNDPDLLNTSMIKEGAFSDCKQITSFDLTGVSQITTIPNQCFKGSEMLNEVDLPAAIKNIGDEAFADTGAYTAVTVRGREVGLGRNAFTNVQQPYLISYSDSAVREVARNQGVNVERTLDDTYTVKFYNIDGTVLLKTDHVEKGKDATAPKDEEIPTIPGMKFKGWNREFENITEDIFVLALYEADSSAGGNGGTGGSGGSGGTGGGSTGNGGTNVNGGIDTNGDGIPDVDANGNKLYKLTVTNGEGGGYYPAGKTVTIKAGNAAGGTTFAYWSCSNQNVIFQDATDWITTLTMVPSDITVICNFTGQYTLEVEYGSGSGSYPAGAKVAISAVGAPQGRKFASWVSKTTGLTIENSKKESTVITMPAQNAKVTATYMDTGSISGNSTKPSQNGTTVMITKPGISDKDKASAYVTGSSDNFIVKISESLEAADEVQKALQKKYPDMTRIKYFAMDISLYDAKGINKITDTDGLKVNITMPIPDALKEYAGNNRVGAVVNGELETLNPKFTTIDGVPSITFTATHFSPYTIYVDTGNMTVTNTLDSTPKTGDGIHPKWFLSIGLACISIILFTKRDRRYTTKAYR